MGDKDLIKYICKYYLDFFNEEEKYIYNLIITYNKVKDIGNKNHLDLMLKKLKVRQSDIEEIKTFDLNKFYDEVITRLIENEEVFINRCPYCGTLARTPTVKRASCGHSW